MRFTFALISTFSLAARIYSAPTSVTEAATENAVNIAEKVFSSQEDFISKIGQGFHLVMFESPDCSHCVDFKPVFEDFMTGKVDMEKILPGGSKNLAFNMVDCKANLDICIKEGLTAVPAVKL